MSTIIVTGEAINRDLVALVRRMEADNQHLRDCVEALREEVVGLRVVGTEPVEQLTRRVRTDARLLKWGMA